MPWEPIKDIRAYCAEYKEYICVEMTPGDPHNDVILADLSPIEYERQMVVYEEKIRKDPNWFPPRTTRG